MIENNGKKVISFYFLITYLIPLAGNLIFQSHISSIFKIYPLDVYSVFMIISVYLLYLYFEKTLPQYEYFTSLKHKFKFPSLHVIKTHYMKWRLYLSVFVFVFSLVYFLKGNYTYRYFPKHISEISSTFLLLGILLQTLTMVDLFYFIYFGEKENKALRNVKYENILLSLSLILFSDGAGNSFIAFLSVFGVFFPKFFKSLIFIERRKNCVRFSMRMAVSILFFSSIFTCAWVYGESVKQVSQKNGNVRAFIQSILSIKNGQAFREAFPDDHVSGGKKNFQEKMRVAGGYACKYFYYLIERSSIYYYSLLSTTHTKPQSEVPPILFPLNNLLFRFDHLFLNHSLGLKKPEIGSICRLNFLEVSTFDINKKTGAAPGLLASFNYVLPMPLNILLCALYLCILSALFNNLLRNKKLSILGVVLFYFYLQMFFQSPFDFLIILDNGVFYVLLMTLVCVGRGGEKRRVVHDDKALTGDTLNISSFVFKG